MNARSILILFCNFCLVLSTSSLALAQDIYSSVAATHSETEASDLAVENVRKKIADTRTAMARHPEDLENYVHLAYALTDAGVNDQARAEMQKAVAVAPRSAFAYNAQAWVLHHNAIGVDYGKGFDYEASLASYRKAIELNPNDLDLRQSLANLLEFDRNGIRYASKAGLSEAIEIYRYVKKHQSAVDPEVENNLIIDLFYAGLFQEALSELSTLEELPIRNGVAVASIAASQNSSAAVAFANQIRGDEQKKKDALIFAAEGLWNMRLYPQAAAMLTAALPDTSDSKALIGKIQIFSNLKPYKGADLSADDPRSPVQRLIVGGVTNTLTETIVAQNLSRHSYASEADWKHSLSQSGILLDRFRSLSRKTGLPQPVIEDIALGRMKITIVPSDEPGSRIVLEFLGLPSENFFVVREDSSYKIVADDRDSSEVGNEALYLLEHNQRAEATSLLNWKRELVQKAQGDDPFGGMLFARLWMTGQSSGSQAIELAAGSLLTDKSLILAVLPQVIAARKSATTDTERDNLDLLLTSIYLRLEDSKNAEMVSQQLLARQPDSVTAVTLAGRAYRIANDWTNWKSLLAVQIQRHPKDHDLLLETVAEAEAEGDFARARRTLRIILDGGHAIANDYNEYAWLSLFEGKTDSQDLEAAEQANLLSKNGNYAYLHTLACIDASQGKTAEARQLLLEAMSSATLEEPNSAIWFGFGLIYEQYGVLDAAIAAYRRVERPDGSINPTDPFLLAQSHLKALHAN